MHSKNNKCDIINNKLELDIGGQYDVFISTIECQKSKGAQSTPSKKKKSHTQI